MANENQNDSDKHLDKTPDPIPLPIPNQIVDSSQAIKGDGTQNDNNDNSEKIPVKEQDAQALNIARQANKISGIGTLINILLFIITLLTFWQTKRSVDISAKALEDARIKDSLDDIKNEMGNLPYLQINEIGVSNFRANEFFKYSYYITNLTINPVKIIEKRFSYAIRINPPAVSEFNDAAVEVSTINKYIIKESPSSYLGTSEMVINTNEYDAVANKGYFIYLTGRMIYKDLVRDKTRIYIYQIKLRPAISDRMPFSEFIYNENEDVQ